MTSRWTWIAAAGGNAAWRFVEFFTANIRNPNTRAVAAFCAWCEERGYDFLGVTPVITFIHPSYARLT